MLVKLNPQAVLTQIDEALEAIDARILEEQAKVEQIKEEFIENGQKKAWFGRSRERWADKFENGDADSLFSPRWDAEHLGTYLNAWCIRREKVQKLQRNVNYALKLGAEFVKLTENEIYLIF